MRRRRNPPSSDALTVLPVRVPPEQREAIRRLAAADGRTQSDLAREAFARYLAERQQELVAS